MKEREMKLKNLLRKHRETIIRESTELLDGSPVFCYRKSGTEENRKRILRLFEKVDTCVERREASTMLEYTRQLAAERFRGKFPLHEVLTAYNTLEEVIWKKVTEDLDPVDCAEALGLVSSIFGFGKECLATEYVSLTERGLPLANPLPELRN